MNEQQPKDPEEQMRERGETVVLLLKKNLGHARFRYFLAERSVEGAPMYTVYADYRDEAIHTASAILDLTPLRETAEGFCRLLAKMLVTPLSLEDIYEDLLTP